MNEDEESSTVAMGTVRTYCGVIPELFDFDESFNSCITAT